MQFILQRVVPEDHANRSSEEPKVTIIARAMRFEDVLDDGTGTFKSLVNTPTFQWALRRGFRALIGQAVLIPLTHDTAALLFGITPDPEGIDPDLGTERRRKDVLRALIEGCKQVIRELLDYGEIDRMHVFTEVAGQLDRNQIGAISRGLGLGQAETGEDLSIGEIWIEGSTRFSDEERRGLLFLAQYRWEDPFAEWEQF